MRNRAQIICIGDELLIGQVINTKSAWLGSKLTERFCFRLCPHKRIFNLL